MAKVSQHELDGPPFHDQFPVHGSQELAPVCVVEAIVSRRRRIFTGHSGKGKKIRMLRCGTCGRAFAGRAWTIFYGSRLPEEKDVEILEADAQGHGIRATARLAEISRPTVRRKVRTALRLMKMQEVYEERAEEERLLASHMRRLGFVPSTS